MKKNMLCSFVILLPLIGLILVSFILVCVISGCKSTKLDSKSENVSIANPVKKSSAEEIFKKKGFVFGNVPEATDVKYSIISDEIAQMDFVWKNAKCTARIDDCGKFEDISGYYYDWQIVQQEKIGWCDAKIMLATTENKTVGVCLWCDMAPGLMYSVAMSENATVEDLLYLAQNVYVVTQQDS